MKTLTSKPLTLVHDSSEVKLAPLKVLVIDDQSTGRIVLSEIMRSLDASLQVVTFADPVEAIEYARKHPVDMVLTDYKMPGMDGIEAIRRLRRLFGYEDIPIVCITVVNDREVRYRALEAGATDFLIRPIDRLECGARCRNLLSLRRHEILKKNRTRILEQKIDEATRELPSLRAFVLPGGTSKAAALHLARTTCRRAERAVVHLAREQAIHPLFVVYLNRLSDLLFTLARLANHRAGLPDVTW